MAMRPILPASGVETDPVATNQMTIGLCDEIVLGRSASDEELEIHVMLDSARAACASSGVPARFKGWRAATLRDRPFGVRTAALHWHKRLWRCEDVDCASGSWTEQDERIAQPRTKVTRRAALRTTEDVSREGPTVNEVAEELGCDWRTVNRTVVAYGEVLVDRPDRFAEVTALGLTKRASCAPPPTTGPASGPRSSTSIAASCSTWFPGAEAKCNRREHRFVGLGRSPVRGTRPGPMVAPCVECRGTAGTRGPARGSERPHDR
jgi:hypothetical protein